jgi:HEPN domain-containing protein
MDVEKHVRYWSEGAQQDLCVSEDLLGQGHCEWSLFIGHLVLEKDLKALYCLVNAQVPPKTHNLALLAGMCRLQLDEPKERFLRVVNTFQTQVRCPTPTSDCAAQFSREFAEDTIRRIKDFHEWLRSLIVR